MGTKIKPYQIEGFYYISGKNYKALTDGQSDFTVSWLIGGTVIKATRGTDVIIEGIDFSVDNLTGKVTMLKSPLGIYENIFFIYTFPA